MPVNCPTGRERHGSGTAQPPPGPGTGVRSAGRSREPGCPRTQPGGFAPGGAAASKVGTRAKYPASPPS